MSHFRVRITDDRLAEIDGTPLVPAPGESVHDAVLDRLQRHAQERAAAVRATVNDGPDTGHFLLEISPDGSSRLLDASTPEPPAASVPPQSPEPSQVPGPPQSPEPSQTRELLQIPGPSQPSAPSDAPAAPHLAQPPTPAEPPTHAEPPTPAEPPSAPAMSLSGPAEVSVPGPAVSGSGAAESAEDRAVPPSGPGESVSGSAVPPSDPAGVPASGPAAPASGPAPWPAPLTSALSAAVTRARATAASHAVPAPDVTTPAPQAPPASMAPEVPTPAPPAAAPVGGLAGDVAERIGRINAEAAAGRLDEAYADATTLRESLAETVGADHPHAVEARALEAYLAHLCGDHREATVLALGVARIRCVNGDERAPSDVARAAAAWQHIEDDRAAAVHGTELLHMWDTLRDLGTLTAGQAELAERTREQVEALLAHV